MDNYLKNYFKVINEISVESDKEETIIIKKGAWSSQEDTILINYITNHGEGRWNVLARNSGLKRTGKSCRLRWKNYLRPNIRRGNFTLEEQLLIIELHWLFGNRWSKIAECLPGRTDNEIKNYWRTRVLKLAKQLNYDVNSNEFREFVGNIWVPRLYEQIDASKRNNFEDVCMGSHDNICGTEDGSESVKANQVSEMDELSMMSTEFGQDYVVYSPLIGCGLEGQGNESPISWYNYSGDLSDILLGDDYLWV